MNINGGQEMLDRLHTYATEAMQELSVSPDRDETWAHIVKNAQRLLDAMPKDAGLESVLAVYVFLGSLDNANNEGARPPARDWRQSDGFARTVGGRTRLTRRSGGEQ